MGNCLTGRDYDDESRDQFLEAVKNHDLDAFKRTLNRYSTTQPLDVFKIVYLVATPDFTEKDKKDFILTLLDRNLKPVAESSHSKLLPFLELFKQIIINNKKNPKSKKDETPLHQPHPDVMRTGYLEAIARHHPSAVDAFRFFLDNEETFPRATWWKTDKNGNSRILHDICADTRGAEILRELLSSGEIQERFLNSDNDGEKMRFADDGENATPILWKQLDKLKGKTPLQVACANFNSAAVQELCVAKVGGTNYTEAIIDLVAAANEQQSADDDEKKTAAVNASIVEIFESLLAQPGADAIRTLTLDMTSAQRQILKDKFGQGASSLSEPKTCPLPLFALQRNDMKLFNTLLDNRCVGPKDFPRYFSKRLFDCCIERVVGSSDVSASDDDDEEKDNYTIAKEILVEYRAAEWFIDLEKESPEKEKSKDKMQQLTPLQAAAKARNFDICALLINAGARNPGIKMPKKYQQVCSEGQN